MRLAVLLSILVACSSSSTPATTTPSPNGSATTPAENTPAKTGPLTEEEFKAMHAPPTTGPAVRSGERIKLSDGSSAYRSLPRGSGPFPAVIVIHEWWGLNANIEAWADRLASAGWAAVAVDLYGGVVGTTPDQAMTAMKAVDPVKAKTTIKAALDHVATDPRIMATVRVTMGWCFGGGWSLQSALAFPELSGAIMYYGQLETDPAKLAAINAPLLGVFGNRDKGIPPAEVDKFDAALTTAKVPHEIYRYDADHAFANPSNPKYDETSAGDAWSHVLAFLDKLRK
jgi:carboxymethylenebutenolidase